MTPSQRLDSTFAALAAGVVAGGLRDRSEGGWRLSLPVARPQWNRNGMRGVIREIVPTERLVSTEEFDEPWYPGEAVGTIVLVEQGGKTTLAQTVTYESR